MTITSAKLANALKGVPQGNYSNVFSIETSTQLDEQHFGSFIYAGYDTPGVVITLPQSNAAAKGKKITLSSNRAGITIQPYAGDHIRYAGYTHTADGFFLPGFEVVTLACNGTGNWTVVASVKKSLGWKKVDRKNNVIYTNESERVINVCAVGNSSEPNAIAYTSGGIIREDGFLVILAANHAVAYETLSIPSGFSVAPGEKYKFSCVGINNLTFYEQVL